MHVYVVFSINAFYGYIRILFQTCQKSLISINIFCVNIVSLENKFETKVFFAKTYRELKNCKTIVWSSYATYL